jgi:hypothetical protein
MSSEALLAVKVDFRELAEEDTLEKLVNQNLEEKAEIIKVQHSKF